MNKEIDATRKQMLRGHGLTVCAELNDTGANVKFMHKLFHKHDIPCTQEDVSEACQYLHDKKLIDLKRVRSDVLNLERDIGYITANGIDVLEGTTPIDGIIL